MKRRALLALAGAAAAMPARAQKTPRIGILFAADPEPTWTLFTKAMAELGYVGGRTASYDRRIANSDRTDLGTLAQALVDSKPDVIVAVLSPAIAAVKTRTSTIPIVFNGGAVVAGMVGSVARPEANLTGVNSSGSTLAGKSLQLFHEIRPVTKGVGLLLNTADPFVVPLRRDVEAAARANRIPTVLVPLKSGAELPRAMEAMAARGMEGVLVQPSLGLENAARLALKYRLPAISFRRAFVEVGGLLSYGADQTDINRDVARYVDRICKGTRPADLPVIESSKVELVVNLRTARALNFVFPPMFLARVDEVIE